MVNDGQTYWDEVADTRWGAYLTKQERRELLIATASAGGPAKALEVGCGGGRWSRLLVDRGWQVMATEVDAQALAVCAKRVPEATCVLVQPGEMRFPCDDGEVRLLLVYEVDPVASAPWFPREAARVLAPGGVLVCMFLNPRSGRAVAHRVLSRLLRRRTCFYRGPSYREFRAALRAAGLEPEREVGLAWAPFTRSSNSRLIPLVVSLEAASGLRRLARLSPWVIVTRRRR